MASQYRPKWEICYDMLYVHIFSHIFHFHISIRCTSNPFDVNFWKGLGSPDPHPQSSKSEIWKGHTSQAYRVLGNFYLWWNVGLPVFVVWPFFHIIEVGRIRLKHPPGDFFSDHFRIPKRWRSRFALSSGHVFTIPLPPRWAIRRPNPRWNQRNNHHHLNRRCFLKMWKPCSKQNKWIQMDTNLKSIVWASLIFVPPKVVYFFWCT